MRKFLETGMTWVNRKLVRNADQKPEQPEIRAAAHQSIEALGAIEISESLPELANLENMTVEQEPAHELQAIAIPETMSSPVAPAETQVAPSAEIFPIVPIVSENSAPVIPPDVALTMRGTRHYATCPHCQTMWNIMEQLSDPRLQRVRKTDKYCCPACELPVSLPAAITQRLAH